MPDISAYLWQALMSISMSWINLWNRDISLHYPKVCYMLTHHTYLSTVIDIVSSTGQNRLLYSVSGVKFSVNNPPTIRHRSPETWSFITLWWLADSVSISIEISLIGDRGSASADEWLAEQVARRSVRNSLLRFTWAWKYWKETDDYTVS